MPPVDIEVEEIPDLYFPLLVAGQRAADGAHLLLGALDAILQLAHVEVFIGCENTLLIMVELEAWECGLEGNLEAGVLYLVHGLLLLLLPLGLPGQQLADGGDGELGHPGAVWWGLGEEPAGVAAAAGHGHT